MEQYDDWVVPFQYDYRYGSKWPEYIRNDIWRTVGKYVTDHSLAVDCGAFIGVCTKTFAKHFEKVVAVEIAEDNYECLKENTAALENVDGIIPFTSVWTLG